jgi:hypothetical protein
MAEADVQIGEDRAEPNLQIVEPLTPPRWRVTNSRALKLFAGAIAGPVISISLAIAANVGLRSLSGANAKVAELVETWGVRLLLGLGTAACAVGVILSCVALVQMARTRDRASPVAAAGIALFQIVGGTLATLFGALLTVLATTGFARGRQLRRFGKILLPPVVDGDAWARLPLEAAADPLLRAALAAQWRENGRTEHASIAAFAGLTLELVALGAPPELIAGSQRDALDELRHTELCFSLARALDGAAESPGAFPAALSARSSSLPRTAALARLAVDSLVDGALHEGVSARVIARLVKRCEDPATREALREIAADEGRHSAHGWDVVEWCLAEGGAPVGDALRGALRAIPERAKNTQLPEAARGGAWEPWGIHGAALEAEEYARARQDVLRRVQRLTARAAAA